MIENTQPEVLWWLADVREKRILRQTIRKIYGSGVDCVIKLRRPTLVFIVRKDQSTALIVLQIRTQ